MLRNRPKSRLPAMLLMGCSALLATQTLAAAPAADATPAAALGRKIFFDPSLSASGQTVTITGITRTVGQTVIVTYVPGDKSELKPGAKIFIGAANKKDDGTLEASAVSVGRDGITPPM